MSGVDRFNQRADLALAKQGVLTDKELLSIDDLRDAWNAQSDAFNSWDELGIDEIIWFAQQQAGEAARKVLQDIGMIDLPPDYIDPEHTGRDREMLEAFYKACRSEGGTADEITLRGLKAVLARWGRPAIQPVPAPMSVDTLAAIIREVDGSHDKGAAALAEAILDHPAARNAHPPNTP
jgi:hypothetical protein